MLRVAVALALIGLGGVAQAADYGYGAGYRSPQYRGEGYYGGYGYRAPEGFAGRPGGEGYNAYSTYPAYRGEVYNRPDARYNRPDRLEFTPEPEPVVVAPPPPPPEVIYRRKVVTTTVTTETIVVAPRVGVGYVPW